MASLVADLATTEVLGAPEEPIPARGRRRVPRLGRGAVLLIAAFYFLLPLYAGLRFSLENNTGQFSLSTIKSISEQPDLTQSLWLSARICFLTVVLVMVLLVPTTIYVHLRLPKLRPAMDMATLLPIVFPPIVLILGVLHVAPSSLKNTPYLLSLLYVVLAMPFVYRSLDAGIGAIDLRVLVEASRSLGGRSLVTLWRVILPNLRTAMISAIVLTIALSFGEYTMASLDGWTTLPVWINEFSATDGHVSVAVSMLVLICTWILVSTLVLGDLVRSRRVARRHATA
jgi:putative spermidine/putrescine transport system permease protein